MKLAGRCHCGNLSFTLAIEPDPPGIPARACTCTFCVKHGGVWTASPDGVLQVRVRDAAQVNRYGFGTHTAAFHVCRVCGIVPFVTSEIEGREYAVVSINALEDVPAALLRRGSASFDGEGPGERLARRARHWIPVVRWEGAADGTPCAPAPPRPGRFAPSFQTPRLVARWPQPGDGERIFHAYASRPEVSRYMMWRPHREVAETEAFIAGCIAAVQAGTRYPYVLAERAQPDAVIGMLEARPAGHQVDLGYVLAPSHWGRGLMPEAVAALAAHALDDGEFQRVQAFCDVENRASQRTLEKAGFVREGRHGRFVVHPNVDSEPRACFMYARCR